jgi:uncharacterized protein (DUF2236 family)
MEPATAPFERHREAVRARLASAGLSASAPGTVSWRINREIIVVAGWGRAILLQFAHPLVASGVNDHSSFRGSLLSSVRRLQSTLGAMQSLTFGDEEEAIAAAAGINAIHDRVYGRLAGRVGLYPAGERYSAHDPELLRWVHATLLESVPMTYELLVGPLTREDRDRYCDEAAIMEPMLDIPRGLLPRNTDQLGDYMRGMMHGGRIAVSETSRGLARAVLFPPRWQLLWPAFRAVQLITIGLLPPGIREAYGFRWHACDVDAFVRWTRALRHVQHALPPVLREWPRARRAAGRRL